MQQFEKIFRKTITDREPASKTPVAHAIQEFFASQQHLLESAKTRRLNIEHKNQQIAEQSLRYRSSLQQKIDLEQKKHQKKREDHLKKVKDAEGRKDKYVQDIHSKFVQEEKNDFRDRLKNFKENQEKMQNFWMEHQIKRQRSYRSQSAARPEYEDSVDRKKALENRQNDFGLNSKAEMLKRHAGREHIIYRQIQNKKQSIHDAHTQQISENLQKHEKIVEARQNKFINDIGHDFDVSGSLLKQNKKQFQNKLKGKLIDQETKRLSIRSNFLDKHKSRSASLASCKCKRINNVEQGITKSLLLQEKSRGSFFTQTLRDHQRNPSSLAHERRNFLLRSQSMRSTVSNNQQMLRQRKFQADSDRLQREKRISDALALKKSIQVEGNCYVRLINVK